MKIITEDALKESHCKSDIGRFGQLQHCESCFSSCTKHASLKLVSANWMKTIFWLLGVLVTWYSWLQVNIEFRHTHTRIICVIVSLISMKVLNTLPLFKYMVTLLVNHTRASGFPHDDVIKWKHFPRYWPFVRGIHRSTVNSMPVTRSFDALFDLRPNKRLSK